LREGEGGRQHTHKQHQHYFHCSASELDVSANSSDSNYYSS
jgi:hypothetical protein